MLPLLSAAPLFCTFMLPLLSVALLFWAFMLPLLSRPSAFMSLPPLGSFSELMLFDFSPCDDLVSCALLLDAFLSWDSEAFMSLDSDPLADSAPFMPLSRFIA